jgi:hypothetical protein
MKRELALGLWRRNFVAALLVLLPLKLALVANNVFGTEGFGSGLNLTLKTFLIIGYDVLGAGLLALLAVALTTPWIALGKTGRSALVPSLLLQVVHGLTAAVSFFTTIYIGGPLNKEAIELGLMGAAEDVPGAGGAVWSSISHYLGPGQIGTLIAGAAVPVLVLVFYPRVARRIKRKLALAIAGFLAIELLVTVLLLPWLINGHVLGIRVHTYGLEKSAGFELASSYLKPLFRGAGRGAGSIADEFELDLKSRQQPAAAPKNPFRSAVPAKTNVILVSMESVSGVYVEQDDNPMPFLEGLGDRAGGVYLSNAYTVWPQTMKAFFSLYCSELPYPTYKPITLTNPAIPCYSLTEVLSDHGYKNALITSADLAYDRKLRFFRHRAFDRFVDMRNMPGREGVWGDSWGLDERLAVENILEFAKDNLNRRFFVFYEMFTAHHPYNACQEHEDNPLGDDFEQYVRALGYIDDRLRDLAQGIDELGLADETLLVIFADHGEGFGQHPGSQSHGPKVFQENVLVPLAFYGPQLAKTSGQLELPVSLIDVSPTILGLLGIEIPCTMKGRDLTSSDEQRIVLFGGRPPGGQMGVRDGRWKYIVDEDGPELLFDIDADRGERKNLIGDRPELAAEYRQRIADWTVFSENLIERYAEILGRSSCSPR